VSLHNDALRKRHELGDRVGVADSLDALAGLAAARENHPVACRVFGAADALRRAGGFPRGSRLQVAYDADVALLRAHMSPADLEEALAQGATMSANEAVAYVLRGRGSRVRPPKGPDSLTRAEREIVDFVCDGLSNPEIAARLFISPRTVQSHLRKAFARLGVKSRGELRQMMEEWRTAT
jgi:DNA-binding CsgD family transcriptional regulator